MHETQKNEVYISLWLFFLQKLHLCVHRTNRYLSLLLQADYHTRSFKHRVLRWWHELGIEWKKSNLNKKDFDDSWCSFASFLLISHTVHFHTNCSDCQYPRTLNYKDIPKVKERNSSSPGNFYAFSLTISRIVDQLYFQWKYMSWADLHVFGHLL